MAEGDGRIPKFTQGGTERGRDRRPIAHQGKAEAVRQPGRPRPGGRADSSGGRRTGAGGSQGDRPAEARHRHEPGYDRRRQPPVEDAAQRAVERAVQHPSKTSDRASTTRDRPQALRNPAQPHARTAVSVGSSAPVATNTADEFWLSFCPCTVCECPSTAPLAAGGRRPPPFSLTGCPGSWTRRPWPSSRAAARAPPSSNPVPTSRRPPVASSGADESVPEFAGAT